MGISNILFMISGLALGVSLVEFGLWVKFKSLFIRKQSKEIPPVFDWTEDMPLYTVVDSPTGGQWLVGVDPTEELRELLTNKEVMEKHGGVLDAKTTEALIENVEVPRHKALLLEEGARGSKSEWINELANGDKQEGI